MLRRFSHLTRLAIVLSAMAAMLCFSTPCLATNDDGDNGGDDGDSSGQFAGVRIDAAGTLRVTQTNPAVTMARLRAARQALPQHLAKPSKLRKISLNRLEEAVAGQLERGEELNPEMIALAGLTRLEYVFFYPDSGDIVLAGPAEGFGQDAVGRIVGVNSGKPCVLLEDLVVALRAFSPNGKTTSLIGVSIDPTQEGLARMQGTLRQLGTSFRGAGDVPRIVRSLQQALGLNEVTISGIPAGTHFAHVLTEADYRMKLIGIGLESAPVPMKSYVDRLTSSMTSSNALVRWFFVPDYNAIAVSEDGLAMKMVGQGVKLIGEDELVSSDGSRKASGRSANPASRGYTAEFTKKFRMISERSPVYSQLRNLVDLSIAAAFIQDRDLYDQAGWDLGVFGSEDELPVQTLPAPTQVETAINAVMKGSRLITPIGGGVTIQVRKALTEENIQADDGQAQKTRESLDLSAIPDDQWWWD